MALKSFICFMNLGCSLCMSPGGGLLAMRSDQVAAAPPASRLIRGMLRPLEPLVMPMMGRRKPGKTRGSFRCLRMIEKTTSARIIAPGSLRHLASAALQTHSPKPCGLLNDTLPLV